MDEGGDSFLSGLQRLERSDAQFSLNALRPLAALKMPDLRQRVVNHVIMGACNMKSLGELVEKLTHEQWVEWHWAAAPDAYIRPEKSVFPDHLLPWRWVQQTAKCHLPFVPMFF